MKKTHHVPSNLQNIPSNKLPYLRHFMSWSWGILFFKVFGWDAHLIQPYLNPKRPGYWVGLAFF